MKCFIFFLFLSIVLVSIAVPGQGSPCAQLAQPSSKFKSKSVNATEYKKTDRLGHPSPCNKLRQCSCRCRMEKKSVNASEDGKKERHTCKPLTSGQQKFGKQRHGDQNKTETTTTNNGSIHNNYRTEEILKILRNFGDNQYFSRIDEETKQVPSESPHQQNVTIPKWASGGINFQNMDNDLLVSDNSTNVDDPILNFLPGKFNYPNSDSTTIKTTTNLPAIRTSTPPTITPVNPPTEPVTQTASGENENDTEEDYDGDDKNDIATEKIPVEPDWDENHPCNYDSQTHHIEIVRTGRRVSDIQCEYNMWQYKYKILESERKKIECYDSRKKSTESITAVIRGKKAAQGDFPHMGAVGWRARDGTPLFMCGSSLISTRFSITAAHCSAISIDLRDLNGLSSQWPEVVRFGSVYIKLEDKQKDPNSKLIFIDVDISGRVMVLKKYRFTMKYNDVALIKLAKDVHIHHNIRPACLWQGQSWSAKVTGWGQTDSDRADSTSAHLLYAELDYIKEDTCSQHLEGRISSRAFRGLLGHQFCAGKLDGQVDTCQGDSGGPLQIESPLPSNIDNSGTMYYIVGITSFGIGCGKKNTPGIYVNVSDHNVMCWIEKNVWPDEKNDHCAGMFEGYAPPPRND